jgi:uncharacterized membrane-anchored protein YhcB (DUF1043 family)
MENKKSVFAAVAGVVVGAGAVIAGAIALSDKKNQKKVKDVLAKGKKLVGSYIERVHEEAEQTGEIAESNVMQGKKAVKHVARKLVTSAEKVTKAAKKQIQKI